MTRSTPFAALLGILSLCCGSIAHAEDYDAQSAQPQQSSLPRITVVGTQTPEDNYRVEAVDSLGPLGSTKILDAPYSISILPLDLIENSQAINFKDVSKYLPLVAYQEQQGPDILRPQTRGMQGGNFQNSRMDGMTMFVTVANALEQFQQIEVLNGVSASLYGPANPSGMFNFVSKRPTDYDLRRVSVTYDSNSIGTTHIDFGGKIDAGGVLCYRLNALIGEVTGFVDGSHQRRALGGRHAAEHQRQIDIGLHGFPRQQRIALEQVADLPLQLAAHFVAAYRHRPGAGGVEASDQVEQCGLAAA